jgi:hypothetical protein
MDLLAEVRGEIEEDMGDSGKDKAAQALGRKGGRVPTR